jgi:hypothetical protein
MSYGPVVQSITNQYRDDPELRRRIEQMRAQAQAPQPQQGANPSMELNQANINEALRYDPRRMYANEARADSLEPVTTQAPSERAGDWIRGENPRDISAGRAKVADLVQGGLSLLPSDSGYQIGTDIGRGQYGQAALNLGAEYADKAIPGAGTLAKSAVAAIPAFGAGQRMSKEAIQKAAESIGPGLDHPSLLKAVDDVERKQAANASYRPLELPPGKEYDPLRVTPGGYELGWDAKKERYFAERQESEGEKELRKSLGKAEKDVAAGKVAPFFTMDDVYKQPYRPREMELPRYAKGTPDWVTAQLPGAAEKSEAAIRRAKELGGEGGGKFYHMGRMHEDLVKEHGEDVGNMIMDEYGQMMGATTAFSTPMQNQRSAMLHLQRMYQGLPVPENPAYPFGHMFHTGTHMPGIQQVYDQGMMDPLTRTKGTLFGGALSGTRRNTVIDKVETEGMGIKNAAGVQQSNPPGSSYTDFMTMRDNLARDLGHDDPTEAQALSWAGFQKKPEDVKMYSKPHMLNIGDRINVTSLVTGRDPKDIYRDFIKYGVPTLAVGGLAMPGLLDAQREKREGEAR